MFVFDCMYVLWHVQTWVTSCTRTLLWILKHPIDPPLPILLVRRLNSRSCTSWSANFISQSNHDFWTYTRAYLQSVTRMPDGLLFILSHIKLFSRLSSQVTYLHLLSSSPLTRSYLRRVFLFPLLLVHYFFVSFLHLFFMCDSIMHISPVYVWVVVCVREAPWHVARIPHHRTVLLALQRRYVRSLICTV